VKHDECHEWPFLFLPDAGKGRRRLLQALAFCFGGTDLIEGKRTNMHDEKGWRVEIVGSNGKPPAPLVVGATYPEALGCISAVRTTDGDDLALILKDPLGNVQPIPGA
jgi:hypothetical protein